jgi:CheY-like chemotaxis protein
MKMLVVDDDEIFQNLLSEHLSALGYHGVTFASSGEEALLIISEQIEPFDCILLDIVMPGMNGIETCMEIQSIPRYGQVPVIMITVLSDKINVEKALAAGASDYIVKPIEMFDLRIRLGMIENILLKNNIIEANIKNSGSRGLRILH